MVLNDAYILWNILLNHTSYNIHIYIYIYIFRWGFHHIPISWCFSMKSLSLMVQIPWNPMKSHVFFRVPPRPIRKWSSRKALRCRLPFRGQQKPWQICGKWEILWDEIWETMGKYGKIYIYLYIYVYNYIYIYFDVKYWFHVSLFFRMVHGFPIYIYLICHMLMICCQSPTWMVIQVATNVDGFCLFFRTHPDVLR